MEASIRRIMLGVGAFMGIVWWHVGIPGALWLWLALWGLAYLNWALEDGMAPAHKPKA